MSVPGRKPENGEPETQVDEHRCIDANSLAVPPGTTHWCQSPCKAHPYASSEANYKEREFGTSIINLTFHSLRGGGDPQCVPGLGLTNTSLKPFSYLVILKQNLKIN